MKNKNFVFLDKFMQKIAFWQSNWGSELPKPYHPRSYRHGNNPNFIYSNTCLVKELAPSPGIVTTVGSQPFILHEKLIFEF